MYRAMMPGDAADMNRSSPSAVEPSAKPVAALRFAMSVSSFARPGARRGGHRGELRPQPLVVLGEVVEGPAAPRPAGRLAVEAGDPLGHVGGVARLADLAVGHDVDPG